jgi:hypothetical protein
LRKPVLDLSDVVWQADIFNTASIAWYVLRHGYPLCSAALSGQAPTPHSGAPKARGLDGEGTDEAIIHIAAMCIII